MLLCEVLLKPPEVVGGRPTSRSDSTWSFGDCVKSMTFGIEGGLRWVFELGDVRQGGNGKNVVNSCVKVEASRTVLPEMASLDIFVGWVLPRRIALIRTNPKTQVLPFVCNLHVVPFRDGSLEALLNDVGVILE